VSHKVAAENILEAMEKEARLLLHDLRQRSVAASEQYSHFDPEAGSFQPRLSDTQYVVVRKYGCKSWKELRNRMGD
jgi:hypothetical protein